MANYFDGAMGPENRKDWEEILNKKDKKYLMELIFELVDAYYYEIDKLKKKESK